jgi:hypothetical protein
MGFAQDTRLMIKLTIFLWLMYNPSKWEDEMSDDITKWIEDFKEECPEAFGNDGQKEDEISIDDCIVDLAAFNVGVYMQAGFKTARLSPQRMVTHSNGAKLAHHLIYVKVEELVDYLDRKTQPAS